MNCRDYQSDVFKSTKPDAIATRIKFEEMLFAGEAMQCPRCKVCLIFFLYFSF